MLDWNGWKNYRNELTNFVWRNIVKQTIQNRKALLNSFQSSSFILWEFTQTHFVRHKKKKKKVLVGRRYWLVVLVGRRYWLVEGTGW